MLDKFLNNTKDYPILGGFFAGYFPFIFYFYKNFDLVNSISQLFIFISFYIISSIFIISFIYLIIKKSKFSKYKTKSIQLSILILFSIFINIIISNDFSWKKILFFTIVILVTFVLNITHKYLIVFIFLMSIYPTLKVGSMVFKNVFIENDWTKQPDNIVDTKFKIKPNVYFIQPDGYANSKNLKNDLYNFDNSEFDRFLEENNFTIYEDYHSNYSSTLNSNSSCFNMKHHFNDNRNKFNYSRDYIMGKNPVLEIFKNNGYKTLFISERAYLMMNKPKIYFDYVNFSSNEIPFFKDGWSIFKETSPIIKNQIQANKETPNFFFIEKFSPGHIATTNGDSQGINQERINYLNGLKEANLWLKEIVSYIHKNDKDAIIIIAADHGGFVGFKSTSESIAKIEDKKLQESIYGAKLAIKWNDNSHQKIDNRLKSSVNLFRILFSQLGNNKKLLDNLQSDSSFNELNETVDGKKYYEVKFD